MKPAKIAKVHHDERKPEVVIRDLKSDLAQSRERNEYLTKRHDERSNELSEAKKINKGLADANAELKERLVKAELAVHWHRGYIARTHEDDVANEELVTVGDVDGERSLVPKRKFQSQPADFHDREPSIGQEGIYTNRDTGRPPPRKHWVNY